MNVISATMTRELRTVLDGFRDDAAARVIVFASAGPEFVAAADLAFAAVKHALPADDLATGLVRENDAWASLIELPAARELMGRRWQAGRRNPPVSAASKH